MSIPPQPPPGPYQQPYPPQGPYGLPGQPGMPGVPGQGAPFGGPQGWYPPQPQKTNVAAIVALVMSVVCAIPFVPLILGFVALSQIRKNGEKGKGLAIAAIVIHGATIAFYAIVLAIGLLGGAADDAAARQDAGGRVTVPEQSASPGANAGASPGASPRERRRDVEDIRKGDCFNTEDDLAKTEEGGTEARQSVRTVACDQPHEGEVYAVLTLEGGAFPGADKVVASADEKCGGKALTDYVGSDAAKLPKSLEVFYYYPQASSWVLGDRTVTCFLGSPAGTTTGSVRANAS
ncbi:hypothetical protein C0216_16225 [Streptomyces globosus]|uniref:Septum formation-related domain-containing protein n=1 Tax=Streptomyces globosus TaxID=68209 RepID=A0A344U1L8_9ACTN|nr:MULTISPECIES: DUF4190 domain-containing protein [Streptomyces]AXE24789.1 hypothetical protein C0216_16225 [Streptomyces globosus]